MTYYRRRGISSILGRRGKGCEGGGAPHEDLPRGHRPLPPQSRLEDSAERFPRKPHRRTEARVHQEQNQ